MVQENNMPGVQRKSIW